MSAQQQPGALAWPDDVVEDVVLAVSGGLIGSRQEIEEIAFRALAAVAPHVAAREAAAERRGIERAASLSRIDIMREWFGGDRYARDYEYLDTNFGHLAQRVVDYIAALPPSDPTGESALAEVVRRAVAAAVQKDQAERGPTQIAMGHGLVDVDAVCLDGRWGLTLRPRPNFIPVGEEHGKPGDMIQCGAGDVIIWLDGPEFGDTIINKLNAAAAIRARGEGNAA